MASSKAQVRASMKYDKENTKTITIKLNKNMERDIKISAKLEEVENRQEYIKNLILKDIGQ